jgi:hypothetical protein
MPPERSEKPESLEARLRRLPPPPVPADLEARLLASIPERAPIRSRRWTWWTGALTALAAACFLIGILSHKGDRQKSDQKNNGFAADDSKNSIPRSSSQDKVSDRLQAQRDPDDLKLPPFTWPVDEPSHVTLSSSIPSDLLN